MKNPMGLNEYPLIIEVTLYRHNLKDNQIISSLLRNGTLVTAADDKSSFVIHANEFKRILNEDFKKDVQTFNSVTTVDLSRNLNSVYFLSNILNHFNNLKFIKVNTSNLKNYSRVFNDYINFDYKILYTKIDLPELIEDEELLDSIRELLSEIKLYEKTEFFTPQYIRVNILEMFSLIREKESDIDFFNKYDPAVKQLLKHIHPKLENDRTNAILVLVP